MKYNKIHDGILEISNFISKQESERIIKIIKNISENFWMESSNPNWNKRNLGQIKNLELNYLKIKIGKRVIQLFESYAQFDNKSTVIQRILPNTGEILLHKDNIDNPNIKYGIILYYNDDYNGGEIEYPELDVVYKPIARSLLIHKGEYAHKVNSVTNETRYMSTFFAHGTKDFPCKIKGISL